MPLRASPTTCAGSSLTIGALTLFLTGLIALVQDDIKRVLAYSTLAQLGYMTAAMGAGAYTAGLFLLFTHAFFKALLFLGAGSVIHAVHSNNMSDMGGLRKDMPWTFRTFIDRVAGAHRDLSRSPGSSPRTRSWRRSATPVRQSPGSPRPRAAPPWPTSSSCSPWSAPSSPPSTWPGPCSSRSSAPTGATPILTSRRGSCGCRWRRWPGSRSWPGGSTSPGSPSSSPTWSAPGSTRWWSTTPTGFDWVAVILGSAAGLTGIFLGYRIWYPDRDTQQRTRPFQRPRALPVAGEPVLHRRLLHGRHHPSREGAGGRRPSTGSTGTSSTS